MKTASKVLLDCLKKNRIAILLYLLSLLLNGAVFYLYDLALEPFAYSESIVSVILIIFVVVDFISEYKAAKKREYVTERILTEGAAELKPDTLRDDDYRIMLGTLAAETARLRNEFAARQRADDEYYTAWIHQIKTPIAVMKLLLSDDTDENKALLAELFRIEQYVEMVLDYIRLESETNDLVIGEYSVDAIIGEVVRKFAPQFIIRKIRLNYEKTDEKAVTDKKWLSFILEQLVSNALKYTPSGEITVSVSRNSITVSDTGIGITEEDLPRIFEKGFTGNNGRIGQQSSGLGLFLVSKAADLLSVTVKCESAPGKGSSFTVLLPEKH